MESGDDSELYFCSQDSECMLDNDEELVQASQCIENMCNGLNESCDNIELIAASQKMDNTVGDCTRASTGPGNCRNEVRQHLLKTVDVHEDSAYSHTVDTSKEITEWRRTIRKRGYLATPSTCREHVSLSGELLDEDLMQNQTSYFQALKNAGDLSKIRRGQPLFVLAKDRGIFQDIKKKTNAEIRDRIESIIDNMASLGGKDILTIRDRYRREIRASKKVVLIAFLEEITSTLEDMTEATDDDDNAETTGGSVKDSSRFRAPVPDSVISEMKQPYIPKSTLRKLEWGRALFERWRSARNSAIDTNTPGYRGRTKFSSILNLAGNPTTLCVALCRFISEVRKQNGEEYPPNTVYDLAVTIQMYLEKHGFHLKFFDDSAFKPFKHVVDSLMTVRTSQGLGLQKKRAECVTFTDENRMWEKGVLGDDTPETLVKSLVFYIGLNFALRSGEHHRCLSMSNFTIATDEEGEFLEFKESCSKTHSGGLKSRGCQSKVCRAYAVGGRRCVVYLYNKYVSFRPASEKVKHVLYLTPLQNPKEKCWYAQQAMGKNKLLSTVKNLCESAGLSGYYTNHSLRRTCATRLYTAQVDEQAIMEQTGHKSLAVRAYKVTTSAHKRGITETLTGTRTSTQPTCTVTTQSAHVPEPTGQGVVNLSLPKVAKINVNFV